jgi:hypothetical protein
MKTLRAGLMLAIVATAGGQALAAEKAELEGSVGATSGMCPSLKFTVGGARVVTDENTRFEDGTCDELRAGRKVEVEGQLEGDGTVKAREIDLD